MLDSERRPWVAYALVGLTLLAPFLGGSTTLWAQAVLLLLTGLVFLLAPPRRSLGVLWNIIFLALAAVPLLGFLPAHLFPAPAWRLELQSIGLLLPATWSPQPWLTLESACLLWFGLLWTYYLFAYEWTPALREKAWDLFCEGILGLAAILTICYALKLRIPFWPDVKEFGFFPNRNQTSNVLSLGGVFIYANAFQRLQEGRKQGWMWLAGLGLICWALILNFSRAGIVLFFVGVFVWHTWWLIRAKESFRTKAIAWLPLVILLAMLLLAGGETLVRFTRESHDILSPEQSGRVSIHHDAFEFFMTSPFLGIGLGNFRSLFTGARHYYVSSAEAIHPESDWLWFAVESGFLGPLLLFLGLSVWVWRSATSPPGTWRAMRVAALICGLGFALHGIGDVSGHRLGSLWPALFLASTALNPRIRYAASGMIAVSYRVLGPICAAIGVWWLASCLGQNVGATSARVDLLSLETERASAAGDDDRAFRLASEGLTIAPLNWMLYYQRGHAEAALYYPRDEILRDFAAARYLLPNWPDLYVKEGIVWLHFGEPDRAFEVWRQGMERWPENTPTLYSALFGVVEGDPDLRDRWRKLGESDRRCLPILFGAVNSAEFAVELEQVLSVDPELHGLTRAEQEALFSAWYRVGDRLSLAEMARDHPAWEDIAWSELARSYASFADYKQAGQMVLKHLSVPTLPTPASPQVEEVLAARFRLGQTNEHEGLVLAITQDANGRPAEALATLQTLLARPRPSPAVFFLESQWRIRNNEWQNAWGALSHFVPNR